MTNCLLNYVQLDIYLGTLLCQFGTYKQLFEREWLLYITY